MASPRKKGPDVAPMSVVDGLVHEVTERIKTGKYLPGHRLVESDLTREFGVSRGPLREALVRLSANGLVEVVPHKGALVRMLSRDEVRAIYETREVLEGLAARLAAERMSADNRQRLLQSMEEMRAAQRDLDAVAYIEENSNFHQLIVASADNNELARLVEYLDLRTLHFQFINLMRGNQSRNRSFEDHAKIANAIIEGQASVAERAMRQHVRRSADALQKLPDYGFR